MNKADKENRRFFAVASLGRDRWYWVVWPSLRELQGSEEPITFVNEGYEKTKAKAVEKALELAGRYSEWIAAKYAKEFHRAKTGGRRKEGSSHLVIHELLYREVYDTVTRQWLSVSHRVVQRTKKYVFVEQSPYSSGDYLTGSWLDRDHPTYRLDRQALEQEGYAFIPASAPLTDKEEPIFFTFDRMKRQGVYTPSRLKVLELSWPCTIADVKEAYRRLVRSAHPDGGGSHEKFLELQAAYEYVLRMCQ